MPSAQRYTLSASVVAVPGTALNTLLDDLGSGKPPQLTIAASSTFGSVPALRPQNLLGATATGWIAGSPDATLHLQWTGRRTVSSVQLTPYSVGIAAQPTQVEISSPQGSRDLPIPQTGIVTFPPLITDQLTISFPDVMHVTAYNPLVGKSQQLPVGLAGLSIPALAGLSTGLPSPQTPFTLGCGQGPPVTVDGRTYATSVSGTASDLTNLTPLPLKLCTRGSVLPLQTGRHWLTSPGTGLPLTVTALSLKAPAAAQAAQGAQGAQGTRGRRPAPRPAAACGSARGEPSTGPPRSAPVPGPTSRSTRPPTRAGPRP